MCINPLQSVYWLVWWTKGNQNFKYNYKVGKVVYQPFTFRLLVGVVEEEESETSSKITTSVMPTVNISRAIKVLFMEEIFTKAKLRITCTEACSYSCRSCKTTSVHKVSTY